MHGDTAGLESADGSSEGDVASRRSSEIHILTEAEKTLERLGEYKAAREVGDAKGRLQSEERKAGEAREGKRSSEALYGKDPQAAEVKA